MYISLKWLPTPDPKHTIQWTRQKVGGGPDKGRFKIVIPNLNLRGGTREIIVCDSLSRNSF